MRMLKCPRCSWRRHPSLPTCPGCGSSGSEEAPDDAEDQTAQGVGGQGTRRRRDLEDRVRGGLESAAVGDLGGRRGPVAEGIAREQGWSAEAARRLGAVAQRVEDECAAVFQRLVTNGQILPDTAARWLSRYTEGQVVLSTTLWFGTPWEWLAWLEASNPDEHLARLETRPASLSFEQRFEKALLLAGLAAIWGEQVARESLAATTEMLAEHRELFVAVPDHPFWGRLRGRMVLTSAAEVLNRHRHLRQPGAPRIPVKG